MAKQRCDLTVCSCLEVLHYGPFRLTNPNLPAPENVFSLLLQEQGEEIHNTYFNTILMLTAAVTFNQTHHGTVIICK